MMWIDQAISWCEQFDADWQEAKSQKEFWEYSTECFQKRDWSEGFDLTEFTKDFFLNRANLKQVNVHSPFGEPPLTIYISKEKDFYLDLYIWNEMDTVIHSHGFEGCFYVLQGTSIENTYHFETTKQATHSLVGKLSEIDCVILNKKQIRPIKPRKGLIHKVLHLSKPTVSLCLRTSRTPNENQLCYYFKSIAAPSFPGDDVTVRMRILNWILAEKRIPSQDMLTVLMDHPGMWLLLSQHPHVHLLLNKLSYIHGYDVFEGIKKMNELEMLLKEMPSEIDQTLLNAWEFFGKDKWTSWVQRELSIGPQEAKARLRQSLEMIPFVKQVGFEKLLNFKDW